MDRNYYSLNIKEVLKSLKTSEEGLTDNEAKQRSEKYGANEIERRKSITPFKIFVRQFTSFIVIILVAAILISLLIGEKLDAIVILIILILNGVFGFIQEYRAEKAIESLRKLTALKAKVIRNAREIEIDSRELVAGDIILIETGSKVPADARLLQIAVLYTPLNVAFKTVPIGLLDWVKILLVTCVLYIILESRKMFLNYWKRRTHLRVEL